MSTYRYLITDHVTDAYICDLPLVGVQYDRRIFQAGTFTGSMVIANPELAELAALAVPRHPSDLSTGPGRTRCHVLKDGVPQGTYWLHKATISASSGSDPVLTLQGSSLDAWLQRVEIADDLEWLGVDQVQIGRNLIASAQGLTHADIGLATMAGDSGVVRDRTYLAAEKVSYGQRLIELAQLDAGFEWTINTVLDGTTRVPTWVWGYPKLGNSETEHLFSDSPGGGTILSWSEEITALRGGTYFRARGDSINDDITDKSEPLVSDTYTAVDHLAAGWPRQDVTVDYPSVIELPTLNDYAAYWAATVPGAARIYQASIRVDETTTLTTNHIGDYATLKIVNAWWPREDRVASFSKTWRVIGISVRPADATNPQETMDLIFEEVGV